MEIPNKSLKKNVSLTAEVERFRAEAERLKGVIEDKDWASRKTNECIKILYGELEKKNEKLKELDETKSNFLSSVSHELRTPLTIIKEGVALVRDGIAGAINEEQKDYLNDVLEGSDRLTGLINNLLDISKLESGKVELKSSDVNLADLLQKTVSLFQIKAKSKHISLQVEPPVSRAPHVYADREQLIQVLTNLIGNAVKFTLEGGEITVGVIAHEQEVEIFVKDTGVGISKEDLPKLFNKFEQFGRTAGPGEKGTGLGLAISKEIVELHGGRIWATSEIGRGTTFHFTVAKQMIPQEMCEYFLRQELERIKAGGGDSQLSIILFKAQVMNLTDSSLAQDALTQTMFELKAFLKLTITRPADKLIEYSADILMILLGWTDHMGAVSVARKVRNLFKSRKIRLGDVEFVSEINYGISSYPKDSDRPSELVKFAMDDIHRKRKILIIDDHRKIGNFLESRLKLNPKYSTECAFDGEEALAKINKAPPDLIVLDIIMPKMSGYEVAGRLKENVETRVIPIIFLTAHPVKQDAKEIIGQEAIPVIGKTEGFEKVIQRIDELL